MRRAILVLSFGSVASCGRLSFDALDTDAMMCPAPYVDIDGHCFRFVSTRRPWDSAEADCIDDVPGATHLAVTETANEVVILETEVGEQNPWIGLVEQPPGWAWVTGGAPELDLWQEGDPEGEGSCARIINGAWDDTPCTQGNTYVCELDGRPAILP